MIKAEFRTEHDRAADVSLCRRKAVVDAVERSEVIPPVEVIVLHGVRQALDVYNRLVDFDLVRENVVGHRKIVCA